MFVKLKSNYLFHRLLKRPNIRKAYKMVGPEDSWYDTITTVHNSLAEIQKLPREEMTIRSYDGLKLKGIFYPGVSDKTIIWIHGYTSHAERESAFPGLFYHSLGFNVLIPYLRAHGPSEGKYIAWGALETQDMMLWAEAVNQIHPNGSILFHGLSMGGGIALDLATQEMKNVKAIISDAPSVSIAWFLQAVSSDVYKKDGKKVADEMMRRFQKEFSSDPKDFERIENIRKGRYPLLISAGSHEQMDEILYQIQQNNPADTRVLILPGCSHGNGMYKQTQMYQSTIKEFIDSTIVR